MLAAGGLLQRFLGVTNQTQPADSQEPAKPQQGSPLAMMYYAGGAVVVAIAVYFDKTMPFYWQMCLMAVAAGAFLMFSLVFNHLERHFRPMPTHEQTDILDEVGLLVDAIPKGGYGKVRFQRKLLGAQEWQCYAETAISRDSRVRLVGFQVTRHQSVALVTQVSP